MKLSVHDRLLLSVMLPTEGNVTDLRILRDLRDALGFTEEEVAAYGMVEDGNGVTWQKAAEEIKEVCVGPRAGLIIRERLEALNRSGKLTMEHLPLYERFVEGDLQLQEPQP